ncbi:sodium/hydrogen antiporter [Thioploca ingrica]|uniref:Sodium/hydrogen antiporter n=1 Tax=Thioploca ingrica TaxID=40754 RepID=A0A090AD38_9GAMM|nr:sodium/hydrogen antiporter [Thioploca ingrica]
MQTDSIVFHIFVIFTGSAILATGALYARQALLVGYIVVGILLGPSTLAFVEDISVINGISHIGIIFLLFLLGLNLQPQDLLHMLHKTTVVTVVSSLVFATLGFLIGYTFGFTLWDNLMIGASVMFSSTIIGLKLLPTTVLHHKHAGELMVSILLLQDLIAIVVLLVLQGWDKGNLPLVEIGLLTLKLPFLIGFALLFENFVLIKLIRRFDKIQEYIFLVTIGWCLGMAELAVLLKLSEEIGAFIGGVVLASSPISRFIAESLKPLRDFFLVIFFFSLGASLQLGILYKVLLPASVLAGIMLAIKPFTFKYLMVKLGEPTGLSLEIGFRLGQISEFSLLIAVVALNTQVISAQASYLIQAATIITFIISSYFIVFNYPTPIAVSDRLRRD